MMAGCGGGNGVMVGVIVDSDDEERKKPKRYTAEGKLILYEPNPVEDTARELFHLLESGQGGPEIVNGYCVEGGAQFSCLALPQFSTVEDFCIYKQAIATQVAPDAKVELLHLATNEEEVMLMAQMTATHTGLGGPSPPSNPAKRMAVQYSYVMHFDMANKLTELKMVFDICTMYRAWGWPLPGE
eukprot:g7696.t1